jgi:purine-binding chemotaxis protein CheW
MASDKIDTASGSERGQMLTFRLGAETYGVDILRVKEIRGWSPVTKIPQSPAHMLGVLNLRGAIVPIVDLRLRFELASAEYSPLTVVIVLSIHTGDATRECGIVVDAVSDVVDIPMDAIKESPAVGDQARSRFIRGLANVDDQMLILLDAEELVARESGPAVLAAA